MVQAGDRGLEIRGKRGRWGARCEEMQAHRQRRRPVRAFDARDERALTHDADIAEAQQEWLGHVDISTTQLSDRQSKVEDDPTFRIKY